MRGQTVNVALAGMLALGLGACGGGGSSSPDQPAPADQNQESSSTEPDAGQSTGARPFFYFVLHADPTSNTAELQTRWDNLSALIDSLKARSVTHHVTIMLTGPWIDWISTQPDKQNTLAQWIDEGHQIAFHSHTHNHTFRDGYTNASSEFGPDKVSVCLRADKSQCTIDGALSVLESLVPSGYSITFAALGPHGNGGTPPYWGVNDNSCKPETDVNGDPVRDDDHCIQAEWTGELARKVANTSGAYPDLTEDNRHFPEQLLGDSKCVTWGEADKPVYYLPHAPFETESGRTEVTLATVEAAMEMGTKGDFIGIVVHPMSYVQEPTSTFDGNGVAQVQALFDAAERYGLQSRTLDEVRAADSVGSGVECKSP